MLVRRHDPLLGFLEQLFPSPGSRREINLEASDGILQHRHDELPLRLEAALLAKVLEELSGQKRVGFKQRGNFLLHLERARLLLKLQTLNFGSHDFPLLGPRSEGSVDPWIAFCLPVMLRE